MCAGTKTLEAFPLTPNTNLREWMQTLETVLQFIQVHPILSGWVREGMSGWLSEWVSESVCECVCCEVNVLEGGVQIGWEE